MKAIVSILMPRPCRPYAALMLRLCCAKVLHSPSRSASSEKRIDLVMRRRLPGQAERLWLRGDHCHGSIQDYADQVRVSSHVDISSQARASMSGRAMSRWLQGRLDSDISPDM